MKANILLLLLAFVYVSNGFAEAKSTSDSRINEVADQNYAVESREKKDGQMMHRVFMGLMLAKSMISVLLMFLSPILQMKGLGLSLINVIINITRFILHLKDRKAAEVHHVPVHHIPAHHVPHYSHEDWSSGANYIPYHGQPAALDWSSSHYKTFEPSVNTADSYFPTRSDPLPSWASVAATNDHAGSASSIGQNLQSLTALHLNQNKNIS